MDASRFGSGSAASTRLGLVCIDVDGTLMGSSGDVTDVTWAATERARAAGLRLALCSGRPALGIARTWAARLDPGGFHVFQNGASVVRVGAGGETSEAVSSVLAPALVADLVARARRTGQVLELYADDEYVVELDHPFARGHAAILQVPFAPRPFEALAGRPIVRAQWLVPLADEAALLAEPREGLEVAPSTSPVMPDTAFVNVTAAGTSKASAIVAVARAYGVPLAETMMVGDGLNDLAALRVVGWPVAMGNAEPEVKAASRRVVGHVDAGGLAEALAHAASLAAREVRGITTPSPPK